MSESTVQTVQNVSFENSGYHWSDERNNSERNRD